MGRHRRGARTALRAHVELGGGLAIDHLGTGWASLTYPHEFPVGALKIDQSFVGALDAGPRGVAIVASTVALGAELDLSVIAEGVEPNRSG